MTLKGQKPHRWDHLEDKGFVLRHAGNEIDAFLQCGHCGRYHGITHTPRGAAVWWTWTDGGEPTVYGQSSGVPTPTCLREP